MWDADILTHKLVVVSDSHHDSARLTRLLPVINMADYCIHCGDGVDDLIRLRGSITVPIVCVRGNNDFYNNVSEIASVDFGGVRALITHGHKYNVRRNIAQLYEIAKMKNCQIVFFGHTHAFFDTVYGGIHFINPGALCNGSYALVASADGVNFMAKHCNV